eukprot:1160651-Pelagomonas_calceolata.AAC.5
MEGLRCTIAHVHAFRASNLVYKQTYDLPMRVWALQMGPYGKALALTWEVHKVRNELEDNCSKRGPSEAPNQPLLACSLAYVPPNGQFSSLGPLITCFL